MARCLGRILACAAAAVATGAGALVPGAGTAQADTCTNDIGNRASVSFCADLTDIVGEIITPGRPDRGPGDWTPNTSTCLGWDGRWLESDTCN